MLTGSSPGAAMKDTATEYNAPLVKLLPVQKPAHPVPNTCMGVQLLKFVRRMVWTMLELSWNIFAVVPCNRGKNGRRCQLW